MAGRILIKNNGFDPHFDTTFKIGKIGIPEVSFLKIRIFDEDGPLDKDDFGEFHLVWLLSCGSKNPFISVAIAYLPLYFVKNGYRTIELYGKEGEKLEMATLFLKIKF